MVCMDFDPFLSGSPFGTHLISPSPVHFEAACFKAFKYITFNYFRLKAISLIDFRIPNMFTRRTALLSQQYVFLAVRVPAERNFL